MLSQNITHRLAVTSTYFVLIASLATGMVMIQNNRSQTEVLGDSTKIASTPAKQSTAKAGGKKPAGSAVTELHTTSKPADAPTLTNAAPTKPATVSVATTQPTTSTSTTNPSPAPAPSPNPIPTPTPAPAPNFSIVILAGQAFDVPGSRIVPFEVVYEAGFTPDPNLGSYPGCTILTPAADLTCNVGAKETWLLEIGYSTVTPSGTYSFEVAYRYDNIVKTATVTVTV